MRQAYVYDVQCAGCIARRYVAGLHIPVHYGTFLTIPDPRTTPSDQPEVVFAERPVGVPEAFRAFFYPGDTVGDELTYPAPKARS